MEEKDTAGYLGKHVEIWVYPTGSMTWPEFAERKLIKSATGFNPSAEKPEVRASYLGFDVEQVVYGATAHTLSIAMNLRDLVDIARAVGIDPTVSKKIAVDKFKRVNFVAYHKDPETGAINFTECIGGFKARSFSGAKAAGAFATVGLEGAPDLIVTGDGKLAIIEFIGNGTKTEFDLPSGTGQGDIVCVENPKSVEKDTGWSYMATGGSTPGTPAIKFDTAPAVNTIVRIYFKITS